MKKIIALFTVLVIVAAAMWITLNRRQQMPPVAKLLEYRDGEIQKTTTFSPLDLKPNQYSKIWLDGELLVKKGYLDIDRETIKAIRIERFSATDSTLIYLSTSDLTYAPKVIQPLVTKSSSGRLYQIHAQRNTKVVERLANAQTREYTLGAKCDQQNADKDQSITTAFSDKITMNQKAFNTRLIINKKEYTVKDNIPIIDFTQLKEIGNGRQKIDGKEYQIISLTTDKKA